ncbi:MAG: DUF2225 domain-containing protein, partial [Planctomycetota bacterium]|nr:DUF2225 domain-containing protein [Planctomycetota bacterium]
PETPAAAPTPLENQPPLVKAKGGQNERRYFREVSEKELEELLRIPAKTVACPVCGGAVNIPLLDMRTTDYDADLCPHPVGKVRFTAALVLCPHCGFSARRQDFTAPVAEDIKAWVRQELTDNLRRAQCQMLGPQAEFSPDRRAVIFPGGKSVPLATFFEKPETLPDVVRCENALGYYTRSNADLLLRGRLAWLCAWAYRREINGPIDGPYLAQSVQRVLAAVERYQGNLLNLEDRVNLLASLYERKQGNAALFSFQDRQVIRIFLAGLYDRLGLRRWSKQTLELVVQSAERQFANDSEDPWLQETAPAIADAKGNIKERTLAERKEEAQARRKSIAIAARVRLMQLEREAAHLQLAADLIRDALRSRRCSPAEAPSYIYLVGEFERRLENFERSRLWLETASSLATPDGKAEYLAATQLQVMADYLKRLGLSDLPLDPHAAADCRLLADLTKAVRAYRAQAAAGSASSIQTADGPQP